MYYYLQWRDIVELAQLRVVLQQSAFVCDHDIFCDSCDEFVIWRNQNTVLIKYIVVSAKSIGRLVE